MKHLIIASILALAVASGAQAQTASTSYPPCSSSRQDECTNVAPHVRHAAKLHSGIQAGRHHAHKSH